MSNEPNERNERNKYSRAAVVQQIAILDQVIAGCMDNDIACMVEGERMLLSLLNCPTPLRPEVTADLLRVIRDHSDRVVKERAGGGEADGCDGK